MRKEGPGRDEQNDCGCVESSGIMNITSYSNFSSFLIDILRNVKSQSRREV